MNDWRKCDFFWFFSSQMRIFPLQPSRLVVDELPPSSPLSLLLSVTSAPAMIRSFLRIQMPACKCDFWLCKDYFRKKYKLSPKKKSSRKRKPFFKSHLYRRQRREILSVSAGWKRRWDIPARWVVFSIETSNTLKILCLKYRRIFAGVWVGFLDHLVLCWWGDGSVKSEQAGATHPCFLTFSFHAGLESSLFSTFHWLFEEGMYFPSISC